MTNRSASITLAQAEAFLDTALPLADRMTLGPDAARRVAKHALNVRDAMPWGGDIPGDIFLAYVLFPRVNNENPEFYHDAIFARLKPRLAGLGMEKAAMEVNRWCFEQATYQSTDGRTANALTVMRRGFGRCGEESVLLVSALRSCGIPARQLYVPLWSHCDDNHAWVEAWVDGRWRYMGACEPELSLDSGWFTAAASKAMLVHTRAWGVLPEGERAEAKRGTAWVVNRTAAYARAALLSLRVSAGGAPAEGLSVEFQLANMAAFGTICRKTTDGEGRAELLCGLGTLRLRVSDGERALELDVDVTGDTEREIDFGEARPFVPGDFDFDQRPPLESRIQPADFPPEEVEAHERWLAQTEADRQARFALPEGTDPLLRAARGNGDVIAAFLADARFDADDARALLGSLREKDLCDVTAAVLEDALEGALPWKRRYPREVWVSDVLCPRVKDEMLYPARRALLAATPGLEDAASVWAWLGERVARCDMEPAVLSPDPLGAIRHGACADFVRDALFVAICRAHGIAARLDPETGEKQLWRDGAYLPLLERRAADALLALENRTGRALTGGVHFSVSALSGEGFKPLELYGRELADRLELRLPAGAYRVMAVSRQIDGSVEGRAWDVALERGEARTVALSLRPDHTSDKLLRVPLDQLAAEDREGRAVVLPAALAGRRAIVAMVAPGQEPTEHFFNELLECGEALRERDIAVRLLVDGWKRARNDKLDRVLAELCDAACLVTSDQAALMAWRRALNAGELRLPLAVAVGEGGEGLFAFVNYNVGSVATLIRVIDAR